ncbi:hypothetical protein AB0G79_23200 [Streptomyces sp. NPDC020807]|uniref:hypothetical protein n=1 Tax=Streptomyces sp. NPDC020807 TaxID=3155119 RepID=UPI0033F6EBAF
MPHSRRTVPVLCAAVVLALSLTSCAAWMVPRPPPEGEGTPMRPADVAGTWVDTEGGRITLGPNRTFVAEDICGNWWGVGAGEWTEPRSGKGKWRAEYGKRGTALWLEFHAKSSVGDDVVGHLNALRDGDVLKFWTPVGDEDNQDPHCVMTKIP